MPRYQKPLELKEKALALAAGGSAAAAARAIGADPSTVQRWVQQAEPATLQRYAAEKRALAQRIVLEQTEAAVTRLMNAVVETPITSGKDVQALAVTLGILDDHYGGRPSNGTGGTRFGGNSLELQGWSDADRITLERVERIAIYHDTPASAPAQPQSDPQGYVSHP